MAKKTETIASKVVYQPRYKETQLEKFRKFVEIKFSVKLGDYWELHQWSCKHFPEFWKCVWDFFGVISSRTYTEVFDRSRGFEDMQWFRGARFNYAENIFKYKDGHVAIISTDSSNNEVSVTYKEMYDEVCHYALSLRNMGIQKGDYVGCYMPNKKEAVYAFLAAASIGAVWGGALPNLSVKAVLGRFQKMSPKVIFSSGDFFRNGQKIKMLEKVKAIVEELPSLQKVILVTSSVPDVAEDISHIPKCCDLKDFLYEARKAYRRNPWELEYEQVPFDCPLTVSFTSGTTGQPKGMIHSAGAYFSSLVDFGLHQDITRKDVLLNICPVGWGLWNICVNCLHLGVTLYLYDGLPLEEESTKLWDLVDRIGLTACNIGSGTAEAMRIRGSVPTEKHSLKTLKQIILHGSVVKTQTYQFLCRTKPDVFVQSGYGASEFYGYVSGVDCNLPAYEGEMQCFSLGMDVRCLDESGKEVIGDRGSLVIANPYPAMPVSLLLDNDKKKMQKTYLNQYPGNWYVGDCMRINPVTRGFVIYGRCDETLYSKGVTFNCSEIYSALENFPGILDCVCANQLNEERDERVFLFVKMKEGNSLTEEMKERIGGLIGDSSSGVPAPDIIMEVPGIPYNFGGKKLNILVKKLVNKIPVPNLEFVANPESLEFYQSLDLERILKHGRA